MRRPLLLLTAVTFLSWIGIRLTTIALPLVALIETGDAWTTGLVGGMAGLPLLTVGWWGRRLRERLTSGRALAGVMAINAAGLSAVPLSAWAGQLGVVTLCVSGLVTGMAGALLGPAQRALTSDLADVSVQHGDTTSAAQWLAWQDLAHRASMIFVPPLGAWLVIAWGPTPLLWCETAVTAIAALALLRVPSAMSPTTQETGGPETVAAQPASATHVVRDHAVIGAGVVLAGIGGVCWFGFSLGLAVLGFEVGRPGALIGAGMSGYGVGSVAASLLAPRVIDRMPPVPTMVASWAVLGLVFIALPWAAPTLWAIGLISAIGGLATPWGITTLNALISGQTSGAERRAAFTAETVLHSGGSSLGLLVGGALIGWVGPATALYATGAVQVVAAIAALWWYLAVRPASPSVEARMARQTVVSR